MTNMIQEAPVTSSQVVTADLVRDLRATCSYDAVELGVELSKLSRWKIGGVADCIIRPKSINELSSAVKLLQAYSIQYVVIGATSNLLFSDEGLRVPCIQIGDQLSAVKIVGDIVTAEAGVWVPGLARRIMQAGLSGAEHICGIPATLGGLVCMNGGTQRKGISSSLTQVESIDAFGKMKKRTPDTCGFSYRGSIFQENREIITRVQLRFDRFQDKRKIRRAILDILAERRFKFPQKKPNCGSVFKSNPAMYNDIGPPGVVIERLGFKGHRVGGAIISHQHANFIVNENRARAADVLALIAEISNAVVAKTGYRMEVEVKYVTPQGQVCAPELE